MSLLTTNKQEHYFILCMCVLVSVYVFLKPHENMGICGWANCESQMRP